MKPWYADGLRFTCTQCGDCCRSHGEYIYVQVTDEDAKRLARHFGLTVPQFRREYTLPDDELGRVLKFTEGACGFLGEKGCTVYEARPAQCRTWPFWPETLKKKVWDAEVVPFCPGAGEGKLYQLPRIRALSRGEGETG